MIDNLTFKDGLFIVLASFFIMVVCSAFITLPEIGWKKVVYLFELYIIILLFFVLGYNLLKQKSNNASYLTQERIFTALIAIIVAIVVIIASIEVFSVRRTNHGFILFISSIVLVLIILIGIVANSALTQRYGLDLQDPFSSFEVRNYARFAESYIN
jgi:hypothetical protein